MAVLSAIGVGIVGLGTGLLSALFGVGGGLVMVPLMVLALDFDQHLAEGTSLLVIIPTAIAGVIAHSLRGYVSFTRAAVLASGGIAGAYAGAEMALRLDGDALQRTFALFLILMGLRMGWQGLKIRRQERTGP